MIRLLTAVLLFASLNAVADDLKTFSDGQVINADDFNHNFQKLEQDIANGVTGPKGDKGDKGDTGDQGPAGADGVAAGLSCTTDQIIRWNGSAWVCDQGLPMDCEPDDTIRLIDGSRWVCTPGIHVALFYTMDSIHDPSGVRVKENISSWSCDNPLYLSPYWKCEFILEMPRDSNGEPISPHNKCVPQVSGAAVVYDLDLRYPDIYLDMNMVKIEGLETGRDFALTVTCFME